MTEELIKATKILQKSFCFMKWQSDDAIKRGREVMGKEDITFLRSLSFKKDKTVYFKIPDDAQYDSDELFEFIEKNRQEGASSILIEFADLRIEDESRVRELGFFTVLEQYCSVMWTEIFLSEEALVRSGVSKFQHLFSSLDTTALAFLGQSD